MSQRDKLTDKRTNIQTDIQANRQIIVNILPLFVFPTYFIKLVHYVVVLSLRIRKEIIGINYLLCRNNVWKKGHSHAKKLSD